MTELFNIVCGLTRSTFANIEYKSKVAIPKKYGIVGEVIKMVKCGVQLNYTYENAVNNRLQAQGEKGDFIAEPLKYGEWEIFNKIYTYKGARYLRLYDYKGREYKVTYFVDGVEATSDQAEVIKGYEASKRKPSKKQAEKGLIAHQVHAHGVKFENILALNVNGYRWVKTAEVSEVA